MQQKIQGAVNYGAVLLLFCVTYSMIYGKGEKVINLIFFEEIKFVMDCTPIANIGTATAKRCLLCNGVISTDNYEEVKVEGLVTLKDLANRWSQLKQELCKECPYNEFQLAKETACR